jgi:hypothetical protein
MPGDLTSRKGACSRVLFMKRFVLTLMLVCAGVMMGGLPAVAAPYANIVPPFGLSWGLPKERLAGLLKGANAKVVERRVVAGREMWSVEGLAQAHLTRTVFYFKGDSLNEAELEYQDKDWLDADYNDFMNQLRGSLETKFGPSRLIARSKGPQGDVTQTVTGYEWVQQVSAVQLVYFSAENPSQVFRMVSLHYKAL